MKKNKNSLILLSGLVILLIITTFIILYLNNKENNKPNNNNKNNTEEKYYTELSKDIKRLNDSTFFDIQNVINRFYISINNNDIDTILNMLDNDFIIEKNITRENIKSIINFDYADTVYNAELMYYNPQSSITYYFVKGFIIDYKFDGDTYEDDINYLVIVKNNNYVIRPLISDIDIESFAKNFNIIDKDIKNNIFDKQEINYETTAINYVYLIKNLIIVNPSKAYSFLGTDSLTVYKTLEEFISKKDEFYNNINTNIFGINRSEENRTTKYFLKDSSQKSIIITEYYPMDFKIDFEV